MAIKDKVASRIKVLSRLDISEKRVPQDGRMKLVLSKSRHRFSGQHPADVVWRKNRHAYSRSDQRTAWDRGTGL